MACRVFCRDLPLDRELRASLFSASRSCAIGASDGTGTVNVTRTLDGPVTLVDRATLDRARSSNVEGTSVGAVLSAVNAAETEGSEEVSNGAITVGKAWVPDSVCLAGSDGK